MRLVVWLAVTGVAFSAAAAACTYPSFHFRGDGGGGTSVGGMPNGGNGAGAIGGVAGTGGTTPTGTGGGTGAVGGTGPTGCVLWGADDCEAGEKCTVVNDSTGATDCGPAGNHPSWSRCASDAECVDRTWCDHETGVCKPVCQDAATHCPDQGECKTAMASGGGTIPGVLRICTAHCDPLSATSCNQSAGNTNCILNDPYGFDCFASGSTSAFSWCDNLLECGPGLGCYIYVVPACRPWCMLSNDLCPILTDCQAFGSPVSYNGQELGVCG